MILAKHITTNSANEGAFLAWGMFDGHEELKAWASARAAEIYEWNHNTPGAVSTRFGEIQSWETHEFADISVFELRGLPLGLFKKIINQIP